MTERRNVLREALLGASAAEASSQPTRHASRTADHRWNHSGTSLLLAMAMPFLGGVLAGCDTSMSPRTADGTSDETHTTIDIAGRVVDGNDDPMPGIVVAARLAKLSDTTGKDGSYRIRGRYAAAASGGARTAAARVMRGGAVDTLIVHSHRREVGRIPVPAWTVKLADIVLSRHLLEGLIVDLPTGIGRIEAVTVGQAPIRGAAALVLDPVNGTYSGVIEHALLRGDAAPSVQVRVYGVDGALIIESPPIALGDRRDVHVPPLSGAPASRPVRIVAPRELMEGDTLWLGVQLDDSVRHLADALGWSLSPGMAVYFDSTRSQHFTPLWRGGHVGPETCRVEVHERTAEGWSVVRFQDTAIVQVRPRPQAWARFFDHYGRTPMHVGRPLPVHVMTGGDPARRIVRWEWKVDEGAWFPGTLADTASFIPDQLDSNFEVALRVTDDLGQVWLDSIVFDRIESGAFTGQWDFEDRWTSPIPGDGDDTTLHVLANPNSTAGLEWNGVDPIQGQKDLRFVWSLADQGVAGAMDSYAGFDLLFDHGRTVSLDFARWGNELYEGIFFSSMVEGPDTMVTVRIMLLSPETPADSDLSDGSGGLLGWQVDLKSKHGWQGKFVEMTVGADGKTQPSPELRDRVLQRAIGLRFEIVRQVGADGELLPKKASGSFRVDSFWGF